MLPPLFLAEDSEDDVFFFKSALKKAGVPTPLIVAEDGRAAWNRLNELAASTADRPIASLVILDLKMPYMDGFEVLSNIRSHPRLSLLPVIILSSSQQESDIEQAYRLGASAYVVKPQTPVALLELVQSLQSFWLKQSRLTAGSTAIATPSAA